MKWSNNAKRNALMQRIETHMRDPEVLGESEIRRYVKAFPRELDCNIAQYGCLLITCTQVREWCEAAGYTSVDKWPDSRLWDEYRDMVGTIARAIVIVKRTPYDKFD